MNREEAQVAHSVADSLYRIAVALEKLVPPSIMSKEEYLQHYPTSMRAQDGLGRNLEG